MKQKGYKAILIIILVVLFSACLLQTIYRLDNKYFRHQADITNGTLKLEESALKQHTLFSLVDNWMYYDHQIVTAQNVDEIAVDAFVYLGQYPDYSLRDPKRSAYGVSTYRLHIAAPTKPQTISIYFPELDSASQIWLNDTLLSSLGDVNTTPITTYIKNQTISFELTKESDLYVIVGNDAHYYSGMYFPPVLSSPQGIQNMISTKLMFYGFLSFSSMTIACYSINLWARNRKDIVMLSQGIATLCFSLFLCKEFLKMNGIQHITLFYAGIDVIYFIMLAQIIRMNAYLCNLQHTKLYRWFMKPITLLTILLCACSSFNIDSAIGLQVYGGCIDAFKRIVGCYILYTSFVGLKQHQKYSYLLFGANLFYMIGILYTLFFANMFEPLVFGWPNEYFSFFVVLAFTILVFQRNSAMIKENEALTLHLGELVEVKTVQLEKLLNERRVLLGEFAHDLKAPVSSMQSFIELIRIQDINIDHEVSEYLEIIERKSEELQERMQVLQQFSNMDRVQKQKENIDLHQFLTAFYQRNLPDAQAVGIYFELTLCDKKAFIYADVQQFNSALENLFYNALSFTPTEGYIHITLEIDDVAILRVEDSGCGIPLDQQAIIFEKGISLRKENTQDHGLGLYITKSIVIQLGGDIHVESDGEHGSCFIIKLPIL